MLKEEIDAAFVSKGESKEHMLSQELSEINGNHEAKTIIGVLGGYLAQFIFAFNAIDKHYKGEGMPGEEILTKEKVQNFLFQYVDSKMMSEKLVLIVGKAVEDFL